MAVPSRITLYQDNYQWLEIDGLADGLTATAINTATITATLYDSTGAAVTGLVEIPLSYVSPTSGTYRGQITNTFNPPVGSNYTLKIDGTNGATTIHIEIPVSVKVRKS